MPIRFICSVCKLELSGESASRHYLATSHKVDKVPGRQVRTAAA